jgi:hypothetical protein
MVLIQNHRTEAALPQMSGPPVAGVDAGGLAAVGFTEHGPQTIRLAGNGDQMHVVRHQAPGDQPRAGLRRMDSQEIDIGTIVIVAEEDALAPIAALRDMMARPGTTRRARRAMPAGYREPRRKGNRCRNS